MISGNTCGKPCGWVLAVETADSRIIQYIRADVKRVVHIYCHGPSDVLVPPDHHHIMQVFPHPFHTTVSMYMYICPRYQGEVTTPQSSGKRWDRNS